MTPANLHYAAGLIEGEGSFHITKDNGMVIQVKMTDLDPLQKLKNICGGKINGPYLSKLPNHKPAWSWSLQYRHLVIELCESLKPIMGKRRQAQIQKLLNWNKSHDFYYSRNPSTNYRATKEEKREYARLGRLAKIYTT